MGEAGQNLFLSAEVTDETGAAEAGFNQLDGYLPLQFDIFSQVNFTHAAFAEERKNPIVPKRFPGFQRSHFIVE